MRFRFATFLVVLLTSHSPAFAQGDAAAASGTVSGTVKSQGKPVANVVVMLSKPVTGRITDDPLKATTGPDGTFTLLGVKSGIYFIRPFMPAYALVGPEGLTEGRRLNVGPGETIDGVALEVEPGGVITGTVRDGEGEPLVNIPISFWRIDEQGQRQGYDPTSGWRSRTTDDRGMYRVFGLPPGRYLVAAGESSETGMVGGASSRDMRYWPDATAAEEAEAIDVKGGDEHSADFRLGSTPAAFTASGRVVDIESGAPVPNAQVDFGPTTPDGQYLRFMTGFTVTNARGEFTSRLLRPGTYGARIRPVPGTQSFYTEPISFEVVDRHVSGIEVRVRRGAVVEGILGFEGVPDDVQAQALVDAWVGLQRIPDRAGEIDRGGSSGGRVTSDYSFRVVGLRPGRYRAFFFPVNGPGPLSLGRVERDGVPVDAITIASTDIVSNIRLVLVHATGVVRGTIRTSAETRDADLVNMTLRLLRVGGDPTTAPGVSPDGRGGFLFEFIPPGQYELQLFATGRFQNDTKMITVANGAVSDVTFELRPTQGEGP